MPKLIVSTAHEVVECLPAQQGTYKCLRCELEGPLALLFSEKPEDRCRPHYETETSGWKHDNRYPKYEC